MTLPELLTACAIIGALSFILTIARKIMTDLSALQVSVQHNTALIQQYIAFAQAGTGGNAGPMQSDVDAIQATVDSNNVLLQGALAAITPAAPEA